LLCIFEPQVKELLGIPEEYITAAHVAVGWPEEAVPEEVESHALVGESQRNQV